MQDDKPPVFIDERPFDSYVIQLLYDAMKGRSLDNTEFSEPLHQLGIEDAKGTWRKIKQGNRLIRLAEVRVLCEMWDINIVHLVEEANSRAKIFNKKQKTKGTTRAA